MLYSSGISLESLRVFDDKQLNALDSGQLVISLWSGSQLTEVDFDLIKGYKGSDFKYTGDLVNVFLNQSRIELARHVSSDHARYLDLRKGVLDLAASPDNNFTILAEGIATGMSILMCSNFTGYTNSSGNNSYVFIYGSVGTEGADFNFTSTSLNFGDTVKLNKINFDFSDITILRN